MPIETDRLIFRRLQVGDAAELYRTVGDPAVMRFWAPGPDGTIQATEQRILEIETHWKVHGFGDWGIIEKSSGRLIGFSGLHFIADMEEVNIGYAFEKSRWHQGLGFEACRAILSFGFTELGLSQVVAVIHPDNRASNQLAQKCGLHFWKAFEWSGRNRVVYEISRDRFLYNGSLRLPSWQTQ